MLSFEDRERLKQARYIPTTFYDPEELLNKGLYDCVIGNLECLVYAQDSTVDMHKASQKIRNCIDRLKQVTPVLDRPQLVNRIEGWSDLRGCYWNVSSELWRPVYRCGDDIKPILDEVDAILGTLRKEGYGRRAGFEYLTELHRNKRSIELVEILYEEGTESDKRRFMDYLTGYLRGRANTYLDYDDNSRKKAYGDWDDYRILVFLKADFPDEAITLVREIREHSRNVPLVEEIVEHWYHDYGPTEDAIWAAERYIRRGGGFIFIGEAAQKGIVDLHEVLRWMINLTDNPCYSHRLYSAADEMGMLFAASIPPEEVHRYKDILDWITQRCNSDPEFADKFKDGYSRGQDHPQYFTEQREQQQQISAGSPSAIDNLDEA